MPATIIAIDARQPVDGSVGGIAWVTEGLLRGLAALEGGSETYGIVANPDQRERLSSLVGERMNLIIEPRSPLRSIKRAARNAVLRFPHAQRAAHALLDTVPQPIAASHPIKPPRDRLLEALQCDLVHFPTQRFFRTRAPAVYNPHDLQHLHYPEFFARYEYHRRERTFRTGCAYARRIAVSSDWVKRDLVAQYGIAAEKIQVIPWGIDQTPPRVSAEDRAAARERVGLDLRDEFALYPAVTWEHKNHLRLLEAFAALRQHVALKLVCCGHKRAFFPMIERRVHDLGLGDLVCFPGVLPRSQVDALYSEALFIVIPSLFEASSALIREAWLWQRPIACAAVTSLPEQAGDSARFFDPLRPDDIAAAMRCLATDPKLRDDLVAAGKRRLGKFTWQRTAAAYRALYRSATGTPLTDDDRALLEHNWMSER